MNKITPLMVLSSMIPFEAYAMAKWVDERVWHCPGNEQTLISCDAVHLRSEKHPVKLIECQKKDESVYFLLNFENEQQTETVEYLFQDESTGSLSYGRKGTNFTFLKHPQRGPVLFHFKSHFGVSDKVQSDKVVSEYQCQVSTPGAM